MTAPALLGANCAEANPDDFDPDLRSYRQLRHAANRYCRSCPVRLGCYTHADRHHEFGLWGGAVFGAAKPGEPDPLNLLDVLPPSTAQERLIAQRERHRPHHTAWLRGDRDDLTQAGERAYQRVHKRLRALRERGETQASALF